MVAHLVMIGAVTVVALQFALLQLTGAAIVRGVPLEKLPFYKVHQDFTCLDGSGTFPWSHVNDDYCDCADGSDEPGTSACPNGLFHCENLHYKANILPSSYVNDGICDCCDGSDEWQLEKGGIGSGNACTNTCWEMGRAAREIAVKRKIEFENGHKIYKQLVEQTVQKMQDTTKRLEEIEEESKQAEMKSSRLQESHTGAEKIAEEYKQQHSAVENELKEQHQQRQLKNRIDWWFKRLDSDDNGELNLSELQAFLELDASKEKDTAGTEARKYLNNLDAVPLDVFHSDVWPTLKDLLFPPSKEGTAEGDKGTTDAGSAGETDNGADAGNDENHTEEDSELKSDAVDDGEIDNAEKSSDVFQEEPFVSPPYSADAETALDVLENARKQTENAKSALSALETEKEKVKKLLAEDYGPSNAFFSLAENNVCYAWTDREYTYNFCPFRNVTQHHKGSNVNMGGGTSLGLWKRWEVPFTQQMYENGQGCWNGPNRNTRVNIFCAAENKLLQADEPRRCEYRIDFATPAACSNAEAQQYDQHMDL